MQHFQQHPESVVLYFNLNLLLAMPGCALKPEEILRMPVKPSSWQLEPLQNIITATRFNFLNKYGYKYKYKYFHLISVWQNANCYSTKSKHKLYKGHH